MLNCLNWPQRVVTFLCVLAVLALPTRADLTTSLTAYWTFDGTYNARIGGSNFNGTPQGNIEFVPNNLFGGQALNFDRQLLEYVFIAERVTNQGEDHSYSIWYKSDIADMTGSNRYFLLETTKFTHFSNDPAWTLSVGLRDLSGTDTIQPYTVRADGTSFHLDVSGAAGTSWHNLVVTYDADAPSSQHSVYVDGVHRGDFSSSSTLAEVGGLVIGAHRMGERNWDGLIDDFAIWHRVLSQSDVTAIQSGPLIDPSIDQISSPDFDAVSATPFEGATYLAQTMVAGRTGVLTAIDLWFDRCCISSELGDLIIEVREYTGGGNPQAEPVLMSHSVPPAAIPAGDTFLHIELPYSQLEMQDGTRYSIILRADDVGPSDYWWFRSTTEKYGYGSSWISTNSGADWTATVGDFAFKTYLEPCSAGPPTATVTNFTDSGFGTPCELPSVDPANFFVSVNDGGLPHWYTIADPGPYEPGVNSTTVQVHTMCGSSPPYPVDITVLDCELQHKIGGMIVYADSLIAVDGSEFTVRHNLRIKDPTPGTLMPNLHFGASSGAVLDTLLVTISDVFRDNASLRIGSSKLYPLAMSNIVVDPVPGQRSVSFDGSIFATDGLDPADQSDIGLGGPGAHFVLDYEQQEISVSSGLFLNMETSYEFLMKPSLVFDGTLDLACNIFHLSLLPPISDTSIDFAPGVSLDVTTSEILNLNYDIDDRAFWFRMAESAIDIAGSSGYLPFGCGSLGACGGLYLRYDLANNPPVGEIRVYDQLSLELPVPGDRVEVGMTAKGQTLTIEPDCDRVWVPDPGGTWLTVLPGEIAAQGRMSANATVGNLIEIGLDEVNFSASTVTQTLDLDVSGGVMASIGPSGDPWFSLGFHGSSYLNVDWSDPYLLEGGGWIEPNGFRNVRLEGDFSALMGSSGFDAIEGNLSGSVQVTGLSFLESMALGADASFRIDDYGIELAVILDTPVFDATAVGRMGRDFYAGSLAASLGYRNFTLLGGQGEFYVDPYELWVSAQATLFCIDIGTVTLRYEYGDVKPSVDYKPRFALCSPLDLHFYDDQGRHVGPSLFSEDIDLEIPGAIYLEQGESKYIELPSYDLVTDGSRVELVAYDTGPYTFVANVPSLTVGQASFLCYDDTLVTDTAKLKLVLDAPSKFAGYPLQVDLDGNGSVDEYELPIEATTEEVDNSIPALTDFAVSQALEDGTAATVTWTSSAPMTSQVSFGPDSNYGQESIEDPTLVTQHSVTVYGLIPGATSHLKAISRAPSVAMLASHDLGITTGLIDTDSDGHPDNRDNCPTLPNPLQIESEAVGLREDFEDANFGGWSFAPSTNGQQVGSALPGDWSTTLSNDPLAGVFSARLWSRADDTKDPWLVTAGMEMEFPVAANFHALLHFDDIQGFGGNGHSYFEIAFIDAANTSQGHSHRFSTTGGLGGDVTVLVNPGDDFEFDVDVASLFLAKYGTTPSDVIVRLRSSADYAENSSPGNKIRTTDVRVDDIETTNALSHERWERGTTGNWSFQNSTGGQQAGSNAAGNWSSGLSANALEGFHSMDLMAESLLDQAPTQIVAAISRSQIGAKRLLAHLYFDEISDFSAGGESYLEVYAFATQDPGIFYSWRLSEGTPVGGDEQIEVMSGKGFDLDLNLPGAFLSKNGFVPSEYTVIISAVAKVATDGPRTTHVRIDPIIFTGGGTVRDDVGDLCDTNALAWNPTQDPPVGVTTDELPQRYRLAAAIPNPFNGKTEISYDVPRDGDRVTIRVYDIRGRLVRTLVDEPGRAGRWSVVWEGDDRRGAPVASGVYLYRLKAGDLEISRKLAYVK